MTVLKLSLIPLQKGLRNAPKEQKVFQQRNPLEILGDGTDHPAPKPFKFRKRLAEEYTPADKSIWGLEILSDQRGIGKLAYRSFYIFWGVNFGITGNVNAKKSQRMFSDKSIAILARTGHFL